MCFVFGAALRYLLPSPLFSTTHGAASLTHTPLTARIVHLTVVYAIIYATTSIPYAVYASI